MIFWRKKLLRECCPEEVIDTAATGACATPDKSLQPCQRWSLLLCSSFCGCLTDDPDMQKYEALKAQLLLKSRCWSWLWAFWWKMFLLENVDLPQLRFHRSVFFHWSYHRVIFSIELLEEKKKKGEKKREEALCFGIIKEQEKPQNERLRLRSGSAWAKLPKLMPLSPGPTAIRGSVRGEGGEEKRIFLPFPLFLSAFTKHFKGVLFHSSVKEWGKKKSLYLSWKERAALCLALGTEMGHLSRWDTFSPIPLSLKPLTCWPGDAGEVRTHHTSHLPFTH